MNTILGWKRVLRAVLLAVAVACFAGWAYMTMRLFGGSRATPDMAYWVTGTLVAGWAAFFASKALAPPRDPPDEGDQLDWDDRPDDRPERDEKPQARQP